MPRYLVIRPFSTVMDILASENGRLECQKVIHNNQLDEVTWLHSYISDNKNQSFCLCDAPSPEAVRSAARRNNLPIEMIVEVRVLNPYFYV